MSKADKIGWVILVAALAIEVIWLLWPKADGSASSNTDSLQMVPASVPEGAPVLAPAEPPAEEKPVVVQVAAVRRLSPLAPTAIVVE